jgi:hypothetical protein
VSAGYGPRTPFYPGDGSGDYMDQNSTDRYYAAWNYGYLHPNSTIDVTNMSIYWLAINNTVSL